MNRVTTAEASQAEDRRSLLAQRLNRLRSSEEEGAVVRPRGTDTPVRLSVDQYRLWLHHSMHPELPTYNEPVSIFHAGPLDPVLLGQALERYASRHEVWRTAFEPVGDECFQRVAAGVSVPVTLHDLRALEPAQREQEDERLACDNASEPFDLTTLPLFRAVLVRMSEEQDRLHLVVHHLIFDGTALRDSFLPELATIYEALANGCEPELEPHALQYGDFALWRERQTSSEALQGSLDFWKTRLAEEVPVLRLPADRTRPAVASQCGAMERFHLSHALTTRLRELAQQHRASLYLLLLASLHVLLFRLSGENDIVIGTGASGRRQPELQGMMGYILDTFPVRVRPRAELSFLEFLKEVRSEFFQAVEAADVPFDQILQVSGARRDPGYHPLFQTFFSFLPPMLAPVPGWDLQPKLVDTGTAKFDLYFEMEERREGLAGCVLYNTDLFDRSTVTRLIGHWTTMLEALALDPETTLGSVPLLTAAERQTLLFDWNRTERDVPATTVHELCKEQAQATPDRIAVQFGANCLTYAQLDDRAERLAHLLQRAGAGPGALVALCVTRSENLLAGLLGILKTGASYLPLDPGTPPARIALCLDDAQPALLVTEEAVVEKLPAGVLADANHILRLEDLLREAASLPAGTGVAPGLAGPDSSAYIIHTSGSTGRPKAVELQHRAVVNLLLSFQREPGLTPDDVLVAVTTVSFDIAVLELFLPIITGARVVIAPRTTALDPFELSDLLDAAGCTVLQATPATWRALLAIDWAGRPGLRALCGGEAMPGPLAEKLLALGLELWNVYGPTETCIWSTLHRVHEPSSSIPVGRPIANTTTYVVDQQGQPVPIGVAGELCIGGMGLAKGYRSQPLLTAEKFVELPGLNGEKVYRTGDYARYRADGTLECQGRVDNQVKVRGYRIELEEVELHLSAFPGVAAAAARVWQDEVAGNRLAGYVVAKAGTTLDTRELRLFLQPRLPEYMIPTQLIVLAEMPLTSNGKTDRKALPELADPNTVKAPAASDTEPLNEEEERLALIWRELLNVPAVGRQDNFFALGGHSLLLVRMFARVNREFSTNLSITTIFDAPTLCSLAALLRDDVSMSSLVPVQPHGSRAPLFLAHSYLLLHALSSVLDKNQPLYGLRELDTDGELTLEARAQLYVTALRRRQPQGPYHVAGWCAAGPLAVEIARQLLAQGESVQTLLLFDSWLPEYFEMLRRDQRRDPFSHLLRSKLAFHGRKTRDLPWPERVMYFGRVAGHLFRQAVDQFHVKHWTLINRLFTRARVRVPGLMQNASAQTFAALQQFRADSLPVRITLIRAEDAQEFSASRDSCGWERVAGHGVDVLWAPGDHETMFRGSNLETVGTLVETTLQRGDPAKAGTRPEASLSAC